MLLGEAPSEQIQAVEKAFAVMLAAAMLLLLVLLTVMSCCFPSWKLGYSEPAVEGVSRRPC